MDEKGQSRSGDIVVKKKPVEGYSETVERVTIQSKTTDTISPINKPGDEVEEVTRTVDLATLPPEKTRSTLEALADYCGYTLEPK